MGIQDAYEEMQKACGIKKGDMVKVLRTAKDHEMGWADSWAGNMTSRVGEVLTVIQKPVREIVLSDGYGYPFFVLEVVKSAHIIKINGKEIPLSEESYNELKRTLCQETQNDY